MKKFVCLVTALFLLISVIPGSAAGADMVNPKVVYTQDFETISSLDEMNITFDAQAKVKSSIVSSSNDYLYIQAFNNADSSTTPITDLSPYGINVKDEGNVATHTITDGKLLINKTKDGSGTSCTIDLSNYVSGVDNYTYKFDLKAIESGSSFVVYCGAGILFNPVNGKSGVYDVQVYENSAWKSLDKECDLSSFKQCYMKVYSDNGTKKVDFRIADTDISYSGLLQRDKNDFAKPRFDTNTGVIGDIWVDNIKVTNDDNADTNKAFKIGKCEKGTQSVLFKFGNCINADEDSVIEFKMKPIINNSNGNISLFFGANYQIQRNASNNTYKIQYRNAAKGGTMVDVTNSETYNLNEYANYKVAVNSSESTADLYVNNTLVQSGAPLRNDGTKGWFAFDILGISLNNSTYASVYIDDIKITRDSVNEITLSEDSTTSTIKASAYVTDGVLIIASYSDGGKVLENVDYKTVTNSAAEVELTKDDNLTYKAFIFDNFSNLKPLCDVTAYGDKDL